MKGGRDEKSQQIISKQVLLQCEGGEANGNLSAILSIPEHPDVKRLNVVVNANAKTPYLAFCKPCEKGC